MPIANFQVPICWEKIDNWQSEIGNLHDPVTIPSPQVSIDSEGSPGSIKNT
jgi:hypothetical protein